MFNKSVELSLSFFIFILPSGHPDSNLTGDESNSIGPHVLVQFGIDSDVIGLHHQSSELTDFTYGSFSFLLEGYFVHSVGQLDSAVDALFRHLLLLGFDH
jgi:hypothetical protein